MFLRTLHHPANRIYSIILLCQSFWTQVAIHLKLSNRFIFNTAPRLWNVLPPEFRTLLFLHLQRQSLAITCITSIHHPSGFPLEVKVSPLQGLLPRFIWSSNFLLSTRTTLVLTAAWKPCSDVRRQPSESTQPWRISWLLALGFQVAL